MRRLVSSAAVAVCAATVLTGSAAAGTALAVVGQGVVGSTTVSVAAVSLPSGTAPAVFGSYVVRGDVTHVVRVACIREVGDHVLVGGRITWSTNPVVVGNTGMLAIRDAPGGNAIGIAFSNSGLDGCPDFTPPWLAVTAGGFRVLPFWLGAPGS